MNYHKSNDIFATCGILNIEKLVCKANKTIEFPQLAAITGNAIAVFTMSVSQEIIEQLACNPIANIANIIQLSSSIASLNSSIKTIETQLPPSNQRIY